jgi:hypothetical protein
MTCANGTPAPEKQVNSAVNDVWDGAQGERGESGVNDIVAYWRMLSYGIL